MNNELKIFESQDFGKVRVIMKDNEPWWMGKEICSLFGDKNHNRTIGRVDEADKCVIDVVDTMVRTQKAIFVNESGLYALLFAMQPQKAHKDGVSDEYPIETANRITKLRKFKRWITHDVIPSIRKNGGYILGQEKAQMTNEELLAKAMIVANNVIADRERRIAEMQQRIEAQDQEIMIMTPKAEYYDKILACKNTVTVTQIAADYGMTAQAFNKLLNEQHIQYKVGNQWILYAKYKDQGYARTESFVYETHALRNCCSQSTKWTQKGRIFLYSTLKQLNILPVCEREGE